MSDHFKNGFSAKGTTICGFHIGKIIGKGTYSKVCLALREGKGKLVACKIINKMSTGDDYINRFLPRELEIIRQTNHLNIVKVFKILENSKAVYVFMEYCKRGDILEYIRANGPFTEQNTKVLFKQIVDAVHYLHGLDIAHRDIKCENIFLSNDFTVKLGDFGFSRICRDKKGIFVLSDTFCGSAAYAAPEILQGKFYDPKKYDIWSLGCILYVMVTAQMPFDDTDIKKMVKDQMEHNIQHFNFFWKWCSPDLKKLQISLLEPNMILRMSIKQVKRHSWLVNEEKVSFNHLMSLSDSFLN